MKKRADGNLDLIGFDLFIALDYSYQMRIFVKKNRAKIVRERERKKERERQIHTHMLYKL